MNTNQPYASRALLGLLAKLYSRMMDLRNVLVANPDVLEATQGCDLWDSQSSSSVNSNEYLFTTYVEAETRKGDAFFWSLVLRSTVSGWEINGFLEKASRGGAQPVVHFSDLTFSNDEQLDA